MLDDLKNDKERSRDRILILKTKDGTKPKSSTGLVDPRLFSGENKLHCIQDKMSLWYFKYDMGGLPEPLKQRFTTFNHALTHAQRYFNTRNVSIVEVID